MVPLLAVSFALFTRIPALRPAGEAIREHLLRGLLPPDITKAVLKYLAQFTGNAGGLTLVGFCLLVVSALALLLSIENTFNRIWQVKKQRPVWRRLALFVVMLLTGPVIVGASLWASSYLAALAFVCLFRFVPNTTVRWRDAIAGGLLAGIAFELGKRGFAIYLANVPTYRTIYGAFAPLLAFLVWVYYSWFITLAAALVCCNLQQFPRGSRR
jgi:membrane protein